MSNTPTEAEADKVSFADITTRISDEMEARHVSWDSLSDLTGLPVNLLRFQLISAPNQLTLLNTLRIANALDIPIKELAEAA